MLIVKFTKKIKNSIITNKIENIINVMVEKSKSNANNENLNRS